MLYWTSLHSYMLFLLTKQLKIKLNSDSNLNMPHLTKYWDYRCQSSHQGLLESASLLNYTSIFKSCLCCLSLLQAHNMCPETPEHLSSQIFSLSSRLSFALKFEHQGTLHSNICQFLTSMIFPQFPKPWTVLPFQPWQNGESSMYFY